jgi:spermidine/putrescine-binding protein
MTKKRLVTVLSAVALAGALSAAAIPAFAASTGNTANSGQVSGHEQHSKSHHKPFHKQQGVMLKEIASLIGVDVNTLRDGLKSGQSIMEIAQSKGNKIAEADLIQKLQDNLKSRLDKAVANGKLTKDKEDQILAKSKDRLQKLVEQKNLFQHHKPKNGVNQPNKTNSETQASQSQT